jgi:hypothetical protein
VDRTKVTLDQAEWLKQQTDPSVIANLVLGAESRWIRYMERLGTYREFLGHRGYTHLLRDPNRLIYAEEREIQGVKIGIAGVNSAWSSFRDKEKGTLWLGGDWQIGELTRQLAGMDFRIVAMHHPPGWFVEHEDANLHLIIQRDFQFFLHGHEHLGWVEQNADGHVRVAAGACYESSQKENGYNFVRLDLATGAAVVWLRQYERQGGGWIPKVIAKKTNIEGMWRLERMRWLESLARKASS